MASIEKRGDNNYRITISCGYGTDGKKIKKTKTVILDTKLTDKQRDKELQRLSTLFEEEVEGGTYYEPSKYSVSAFIDKWLEEHGVNLEEKTLYRYKGMLNGRIKNALGNMKLCQVKPLHLIDFYKNLQEVGIREDTKYIAKPEFKELITEIDLDSLSIKANVSKRTIYGILSGKVTTRAHSISQALGVKIDKIFTPSSEPEPLSNKTIQHYHRVLRAMFTDAVRWGLIRENPCAKVQPPKAQSKEMHCLDEMGIESMLNCLDSEDIRLKVLITLLIVSGCRRGEIAALQWENIDFENSIMCIKQAAIYTPETGIQIKQPKTKSSIRKIKLPTSTIELLRLYKKHWLEEKLKAGDQWQKAEKEKSGVDWVEPGWLFTTWEGYIVHPDTATKIFKKFLKRHNLPDIRLHDLRHTAATFLINSGMNVRAVAHRMGHANANVTLAIYSHALQSADEEAANVMEGLMGGTKQLKSVK